MSDHEQAYRDGRLATTSGAPPKHFDVPAPDPSIQANGQHPSYWVLSESERAKGFVRPVRDSYRHVGPPGPKYPLEDLTEEQHERYAHVGYVKFEPYPRTAESSVVGRYWTQADLDAIGKGCRTVTTMGRALAETYAREPGFYGATMCCGCQKHLPVGASGEFTWMDYQGQDTAERVGT
jgi:hypothetical protein